MGRARATARGRRPKIHPSRAHAARAPSLSLALPLPRLSVAPSIRSLSLPSPFPFPSLSRPLLICHPSHPCAAPRRTVVHPRARYLLSLFPLARSFLFPSSFPRVPITSRASVRFLPLAHPLPRQVFSFLPHPVSIRFAVVFVLSFFSSRVARSPSPYFSRSFSSSRSFTFFSPRFFRSYIYFSVFTSPTPLDRDPDFSSL